MRAERGAAVTDFALTSGLVTLVFLGVAQLGLALHVRNTLLMCASEGARVAARADARPEDGVVRARQLIETGLSERFARDIAATQATVGDVAVIEVRVRAPLPVLGPLGPDGALDVVGRAFLERQ